VCPVCVTIVINTYDEQSIPRFTVYDDLLLPVRVVLFAGRHEEFIWP
jgi:hypothetical protein